MSSDRAQDRHKSRRKLTRSKYTDIMIKVDEDIFHLNRLELALMSDYFENLFTTNFVERNQKLIEIPIVDSETFGKIIDIIYGENLESVFNVDNYVLMLRALDYFQMEIDSKCFSKFVREKLERTKTLDMKIFEAYRFVVESGNYNHLLSAMFGYISQHLEKVVVQEEIVQIPLNHLMKILNHNHLWWDIRRRRIVSEICAKWIHHDLENRLVHVLKLLNAAREGLHFFCEVNEEDIRRYFSNTSECWSKYENIQEHFFKLLAYGSVVHYDHLYDSKTLVDPSDGDSKGDQCELENVSHNVPKHRSHEEKLREYLENGTFYDIVVKVEDKIYKLHRSILQSKTSYFEEICSAEHNETNVQCPENTHNLPNNDRVYLIEGVDQKTFDNLILYMYFKETGRYENIVNYLKAIDLLKITELQENHGDSIIEFLNQCEKISKSNSIKGTVDLLHYINEKQGYEDLFVAYLCQHLECEWPNIGNMEQFCSISCDLLEDVISSNKFYMKNPYQILDICSTWIMHDVQNRYRFIPRLALAIKQYSGSDYDDCEIDTGTDFENCSQQLVRDRLMKILSSISLIPSDTFPDEDTRRKNMPVFITSTSGQIYNILNENFDRISTLYFPLASEGRRDSISAAAINDNVVIWCLSGFQVYNIPSNSFFSLGGVQRFSSCSKILVCGNEIYLCDDIMGDIFKYCALLNRWERFLPNDDENKRKRICWFTSDGEKLYRMYRLYDKSESETVDDNSPKPRYMIESYSFEQKGWVCLPNIPKSLLGDHIYTGDRVVGLTIINGSDIAVLCESKIIWFHRNSRTWRKIYLPVGQQWRSIFLDGSSSSSVIAHGLNGILQVFDHKLYQLSPENRTWQLKKELPDEFKRKSDRNIYGNIIAIHRPIVRHN